MRQDFAQVVKAADRARYYSVLFAPNKVRDALLTLYAFDVEIRRIPFLVSEPALGAIRMQWWIDGLTGERREEMRSHPIGEALLDLERQIHLPLAPLIALVEERSNLLLNNQDNTLLDEGALESSFGKTHAMLLYLAAFILNEGVDPLTSDLSGHAGMVLGLIVALRNQTLPINADDLVALAFEHLAKARTHIETIKPDLMSAYLPLVEAQPFLQRARRKSGNTMQREISNLYLLTRMVMGLV